MSTELYAVAIMHPTPGKESRLKEVLIEYADKVQELEKDVYKFQLFEQYPFLDQTGPNVFLYQETYAHKEAVDVHMKSTYFLSTIDTLTKEELLTKPIEMIAISPIGGFASR